MNQNWKRTWIDIDLDRLTDNYRSACQLTDALVTCVVKSNAYGHGAAVVAQCLQEAGCRSFAVSCIREGLELRTAGVTGEILVMGALDAPLAERALQEGLTLTVIDGQELALLEELAEKQACCAAVHIKVNTGFHRLGFPCTEEAAESIAAWARKLQRVAIRGVYTHLGLVTRQRDELQHDRLLQFSQWLEQRGVQASDVHICDSIGLVRYPTWHHSRVRVGALLYGVRPGRTEHMDFTCEQTLALRTRVAQVHAVDAGEVVGYGDDMILTRPSRIATLCAGYGDGYPRSLSNGRGKVMIRGQLAPVVGLICMDQMMVDVTDIPDAQPGDTADLVGGGISLQEVSEWGHTNRNECITIMSRRPVRVYHQQGRVRTVLDSMLDERRDD